jgi:hypothetical protein
MMYDGNNNKDDEQIPRISHDSLRWMDAFDGCILHSPWSLEFKMTPDND